MLSPSGDVVLGKKRTILSMPAEEGFTPLGAPSFGALERGECIVPKPREGGLLNQEPLPLTKSAYQGTAKIERKKERIFTS